MLPTNFLFSSFCLGQTTVILFLLVSLTTKWINFSAYKIMQPDLSSISPGMRVQHHCSEHYTGFQWKLGSNTKLLVSVFNVSIRTVCHHIVLTFFIHTIPLGCCTLLTPLCWQSLTSRLMSLHKDDNNNNNNRIEMCNLRFWQSPNCAANCLQHIRSSGPGAIMFRSRATHWMFISYICNMPCATWYEGTAQLLSLTEL